MEIRNLLKAALKRLSKHKRERVKVEREREKKRGKYMAGPLIDTFVCIAVTLIGVYMRLWRLVQIRADQTERDSSLFFVILRAFCLLIKRFAAFTTTVHKKTTTSAATKTTTTIWLAMSSISRVWLRIECQVCAKN